MPPASSETESMSDMGASASVSPAEEPASACACAAMQPQTNLFQRQTVNFVKLVLLRCRPSKAPMVLFFSMSLSPLPQNARTESTFHHTRKHLCNVLYSRVKPRIMCGTTGLLQLWSPCRTCPHRCRNGFQQKGFMFNHTISFFQPKCQMRELRTPFVEWEELYDPFTFSHTRSTRSGHLQWTQSVLKKVCGSLDSRAHTRGWSSRKVGTR